MIVNTDELVTYEERLKAIDILFKGLTMKERIRIIRWMFTYIDVS